MNDRLEKIKTYQRYLVDKAAKEAKAEEDLRNTLIGQIKELGGRIEELIKTENSCLENGVLVTKTCCLANDRWEKGEFFTNSVSHKIGFAEKIVLGTVLNEVEYMGIDGSGANGKHYLRTDGKAVFCASGEKPDIYQMKQFLASFNEFESAFYAYVDKIVGEVTLPSGLENLNDIERITVETIASLPTRTVEEFLGYPISSDVLEGGLEEKVCEVFCQMPSEELQAFLNKHLTNRISDVNVGDTVVASDEYSHDYCEHLVRIMSVESDKEYVTKTNPEGIVLYGVDLDFGPDEGVGLVHEGNFVCISKKGNTADLRPNQLKRCIYLTLDEFNEAAKACLGSNVIVTADYDGMSINSADGNDLDPSYILACFTLYFNVGEIVSYHVENNDHPCVWIVYEDKGDED